VSSHTAHIVPAHKLRCDQVQRQAGGGGVNVARVLRRLGGQVQALAALGGTTGGLIAELLHQEGVDLIAVPIAGHTRESFTVTEDPSGQEYRFVLPGPVLSRAEWLACLDTVDAVMPPPAWVVASGSLPPGVPIDFYGQLAQRCKARGLRVLVDTSGPALQAALEAGVTMVKPSVGEMRGISGLALTEVSDIAQLARTWVERGYAEVVVVSMGESGALMVSRDGTVHAAAVPVPVVSTVGAGDSFVAGMVFGLVRGDSWADAFCIGLASASAAVECGTVGGFGWPEVQVLLAQVVPDALVGE
jgi:6-phosphofructokinase 2